MVSKNALRRPASVKRCANSSSKLATSVGNDPIDRMLSVRMSDGRSEKWGHPMQPREPEGNCPKNAWNSGVEGSKWVCTR